MNTKTTFSQLNVGEHFVTNPKHIGDDTKIYRKIGDIEALHIALNYKCLSLPHSEVWKTETL